MIDRDSFEKLDLSISFTEDLDRELKGHLDKGSRQEDLTFALWQPSQGATRYTAILQRLILPREKDRILQGNVAFTSDYLLRVLEEVKEGYGIALLHSHLGPGWQTMSYDDVIAERDRLAAVVAGKTKLPLVGLTRGTDGYWSGRFWLREPSKEYVRKWVKNVRVIGQQLRVSFNPQLSPPLKSTDSQIATVSVWGEENQSILSRLHIGIVGLGSVGSIVAEALSRIGVSRITLIDHDKIELRNLDRTLGAKMEDVINKTPKVKVSERVINASHTSPKIDILPFEGTLRSLEGLSHALDCDILFSCVDRPFPRHMLNSLAYGHLIPVIDGGIKVKVNNHGKLLHADWRIHTVGPGRACMVCLGALNMVEVALDMDGKLDDPVYIQGLGPELNPLLQRQNVFPFSLSVAAHEVLHLMGLIAGNPRIGGIGPQFYHCYPGMMEVEQNTQCSCDCEYNKLTGQVNQVI